MASTFTANDRLPVLLAVIGVLGILAVNPNFAYESGPTAAPFGGDFLQEWVGGWITARGDGSRLYDLRYAIDVQHSTQIVGFQWDQDAYLPIVYPPFYYLLVSPLAALTYVSATWLWAGMMAGCLFAAMWLLGRSSRPDWNCGSNQLEVETQTAPGPFGPNGPTWLPWLLPAAVVYMPVMESISSGQKGTLCLLLFAATFVLWNNRRSYLAGVVFGLMLFKPQLCLAMLFLAVWKRQWRLLAGVTTTAAVLSLVSLSMGPQLCRHYVEFLLGAGSFSQNAGYDLAKSHSVFGFAELLLGWGPTWLMKGIGLLLAGGVLWLTSRLWSGRVEPGSPRFQIQFAGAVVASLLISPHLFTYDLTLLLLPMVVSLKNSDRRPALRWLAVALYVLPGVSVAIAAAVGIQPTVLAMGILLYAFAQRRPLDPASGYAVA